MKLSMSYSQALNDPTYCEEGVRGGAELIKLLRVKPNQAVPLIDVLPHVKINEILWCLRAVKPSMRKDADKIAWKFVRNTCGRLLALQNDERLMRYLLAKINGKVAEVQRKELEADYGTGCNGNKVIRVGMLAVAAQIPSQIAINVSQAAMVAQAIVRPGIDEEQTQRDNIQELLK